jgi:hypothetical protein
VADKRRALRPVVLALLGTTLAGVAGITLVEAYRPAFLRWVTEDQAQLASRVRLTFAGITGAVCLPGLGLAAFLWRRSQRTIAVALAVLFTGLAVLLWRLAALLLPSSAR